MLGRLDDRFNCRSVVVGFGCSVDDGWSEQDRAGRSLTLDLEASGNGRQSWTALAFQPKTGRTAGPFASQQRDAPPQVFSGALCHAPSLSYSLTVTIRNFTRPVAKPDQS